jgi:hypothetical protein
MLIRTTGAAGTASAINSPIADQILMLAALRDHGMVTDHDFRARKADLLSKMLERVSHRAPPARVRDT